jgi:ribosomal protein L13E
MAQPVLAFDGEGGISKNGLLSMERKPRNLGRAYLVEELRKRGLSKRHAVRILNMIIAEMKKALKRGREVEFPFGKLKRVKRHFSKWWDSIDDHPANKEPYSVEHELDEEGERQLNGKEGGAEGAAPAK